MDHPEGAGPQRADRVDFDRRVRLEFRGAQISSDGGLLVMRELDDALGLSNLASSALRDTRRGKNTIHRLDGLFRQSVFGRLAGYEDVNDAGRLALDPVMRQIVGGRAVDAQAASDSQMGRFETETLALPDNRAALTDLNGQWIDRFHDRNGLKYIVLDMYSSVSPTHGDQERSAWNGHFDCTCYHPNFMFNQFGMLERCALRHGNVHSADGWRDVLDPVIARYAGRDLGGRLFLRHPIARQQRPAREDRASADPVRGAAFADQSQTLLRGLRVSGGVLGQGTPGDRQVRMASGRAVPACRLREWAKLGGHAAALW